MTSLSIVEPSLDELAARANEEYAACVGSAKRAVGHAISCGEVLLAAKRRVPRGEWEQWVHDNFMGRSQAKAYVRLAFYKDHLPDYETSIGAAVGYLRGLPSIDGTGQAHPPEVREEALRLCREGMSNRQAAALLGIGKNSVDRWVREYTGKRGKDERDGAARRRLARERAQRQAWRKEQRRRAAQRTGGSASAAYALLRRTCDVLGTAIEETTDRETKGCLQRALADLHRADDAIVEAMGWEYGQRREAA